jgi:hypothetical protein
VVFQNTGLQLSVQNWVEMVDYFYAQNFAGATPGVSGATPQNQIAFTGFSNNDTAWLAFDQQIMPVPEPSLYGAVLIALAGALATGRRRRCAQ